MTLDIADVMATLPGAAVEADSYCSATVEETAAHIGGRVSGLFRKPLVGRKMKRSVGEYLAKFEAQLAEEGMTEHVGLIMGEAWKLITSVDCVKEIRVEEISLRKDFRAGLSKAQWTSAETLVKTVIEKLQRLNTLERKGFEMFKKKFVGRLAKAKLNDAQAGLVAELVWDARGVILNG